MTNDWLTVTVRKAVGKGGSELPPSTRKTLEAQTLDWVRRNRATLPHLALPQQEHAASTGSKARVRREMKGAEKVEKMEG